MNFKLFVIIYGLVISTCCFAEQVTKNDHTFVVSDKFIAEHNDVVNLILDTESMDNTEKQYWLDTLPKSDAQQVKRLFDILNTEKKALQNLENKYILEIFNLNIKHFIEWKLVAQGVMNKSNNYSVSLGDDLQSIQYFASKKFLENDIINSIKLYEKSSQNNNPDASFALALFYENHQNINKSAKFYVDFIKQVQSSKDMIVSDKEKLKIKEMLWDAYGLRKPYEPNLIATYATVANFEHLTTFSTLVKQTSDKLDYWISSNQIADPQVLREVQALSKPAPLAEWLDLSPSTDQDQTTVRVRLADAGGGMGRVELRLNGAVVGDLTANGGRNAARFDLPKADTERSTTLRLPAGTHQLEVWAYNAENLINFTKLYATIKSTYQAPRKPRLHAVVVGVDTYESAALQLNFSVADAKAIGAVLKRQIDNGALYSGGEVRVLTTKAETNKASIMQALQTLHDKERVHTDDVFVFFVAGHGSYDRDVSRYHMFTSDVLHLSADRLMKTTIVSEELRELIRNIPAQKKLIALDTCNSGGFAKEGAQNFVKSRDAMGEQQIIDSMKLRTGAAVFAASGSEQVAREGYEGHGVFSYYLLQGLSGAAARPNSTFVSTDDLKIYIEEQLPAAMERKKWGKQAPSISTHQDGFPVAAR